MMIRKIYSKQYVFTNDKGNVTKKIIIRILIIMVIIKIIILIKIKKK